MSVAAPDPAAAERLLADLVAIPSPSGQEDDAADFVARFCAAHGLEHERVGKSVLVRVAGRAPGPRLLLNSHLDTVPVGEGWDGDPYDATWRADGRMVARGANDAKAAAAAMLWSAAELAGTLPAGELLVALNAEEETSNAGMVAVLAHLGFPAERIDGAVTGEPTSLEVVRAQSGLGVLEARWRGRSCHAAHVAHVPNESALFAAVRALASLPNHLVLAGEHPLLGASTLVCTVLESGARHNVVPDAARAVFDARLAPPHDAAECRALLAERLSGAEITVRSERLKPHETAADHPLVRAALAAAGRTAAIGSSTLSDMALLQGVPAVKCGPGVTARSHTPNEYVTRAEYRAGCAFYHALVPAALEALADAPRANGGFSATEQAPRAAAASVAERAAESPSRRSARGGEA